MAAKTATPEPLNWYGLQAFGIGPHSIPLTGNRTQDQFLIESIAFRISHAQHEGGLSRFGHFREIVGLLWNNEESGSYKRYTWGPWGARMIREMCDEPELAVAGCASAGKCFSLDTGILMFDGSTKRADAIVAGDRVMGDDSTPRIVQEVHRGHGPMFEVKPEQGEAWHCTEDHVLVLKRTYTSKKGWRRLGEVIEIPANEYVQSSLTKQKMHRQFCLGVEFPEQPIEFDPRLFGIWLGDGARHRCKISIPRQEPEVLAYVKEWCGHNGYEMNEYDHKHLTCPTYALFPLGHVSAGLSHNPLWRFLRSTMVEKEKRIPRHYLINLREVRMNLLAGLLDTDGYAGRTYFEIATKFPGLKDDITFLARSLGFRVSAVFKMAKCGEKYFPSWRITIFGSVTEIPTLRKKCQEKTLRKFSDCTGINLTPAGDMDWVGFSVGGNHRFLLSDFTVVHNSDPAALYAVVSYICDPTHTLVITMSTTLKEAKQRIWKTLLEYWMGVKNLPGAYMKSSNEIKGLSYDGTSYGQSSGILLMAGDQSMAGESVNKLIGIKPGKTGEPKETYEEIVAGGEFADLVAKFDEETLRDLLPRLNNLSHNRTGKLIILLDEMTGISESVLDAIMSNMKFANKGHIQIIGLGNPEKVYDTFGIYATPQAGWENVDLENDDEWETKGGGKCIRFDAEKSPRITDPDGAKYHWLPSKEAIDGMVRQYGRKSKYFLRMVKAMWSLDGGEDSIYSPADVELSGSRKEKVTWGFAPPVAVSFLDPSFTAGGDKASATYGLVGEDITGERVFLREATINIEVDVTDQKIPVTFQIVRNWKRECQLRGVLPQNAAYDRTGGGESFGGIVHTQWSPLVTGVTSAGPASKTPMPGEFHPAKPGETPKPILACERFANRATEIWYSAHPLFRSQQIFGVNESLAKEMCSRRACKKSGIKLKVEEKPVFRSREGKSPDESDSFLGLVDFCRTKFKLLPTERQKARETQPMTEKARNVMHVLRERAHRITNKKSLRKG